MKLRHFPLASLLAGALVLLWGLILFLTADLWARLDTVLSLNEKAFFVLWGFAPLALFVGLDWGRRPLVLWKHRVRFVGIMILALGGTLSIYIQDVEKPIGAAILWAATFATLGWYVHYANSRDLQRKTHTMNVITGFLESAEFRRHEENIKSQYPHGTDIPPNDISKLKNAHHDGSKYDTSGAGKPPPVMDSVLFMLNFYEYLAVAILQDDLDRTMVENTLGGIIPLFCQKTKSVIKISWQKDHENYEHLRRLVYQWKTGGDKGWESRTWFEDGNRELWKSPTETQD